MAYQFKFFAWAKTESSDKVWGYFTIDAEATIYNFWGRRGKRMTFKRYDSYDLYKLIKLSHEKTEKGYREVTPDKASIDAISPGFIDEFEKQFVLAKLFQNYHRERLELDA